MTREEAIRELIAMKPHIDASMSVMGEVAYDMAIEALKEQKTGKWIGNELGRCSVCGHEGCASDIWDRCEKHYCPNCGTLLEEEQ